jgi:amidase
MTYVSAIGPLARCAADLRIALAATAGPEDPRPKYTWSLAPPRHERLKDFRVGGVLDNDRTPVSSEVAGPLSDAVDAIARGGASIVEGWPDGIEPVLTYESFGFPVGAFFAFQDPDGDGQELSGFVAHEHRRLATRAAWEDFRDIDVFVCPTNFTPAFPDDTRQFEERTITTPEGERSCDDQAFWVSQRFLPGLPALAAPVGNTGTGLPVEGQIIGLLYEDDTAMTFAELLEKSRGWLPTTSAVR